VDHGSARDAYLEGREHLALLLAVNQRVVVLHRDERREVVRDGVVCARHVSSVVPYASRGLEKPTLHDAELPRPTRAHPDVSDVAGLDDVMEGLHGLLNGGIWVETMALQDIDVVQLKSLQRGLNGVEDVLCS
jgi:hypothetical protein